LNRRVLRRLRLSVCCITCMMLISENYLKEVENTRMNLLCFVRVLTELSDFFGI
jgi:hypothetical protein